MPAAFEQRGAQGHGRIVLTDDDAEDWGACRCIEMRRKTTDVGPKLLATTVAFGSGEQLDGMLHLDAGDR